MSADDEVQPFVAYRVDRDKMDFALWPLPEGGNALALFLTPEAARGFLDTAQLAGDWRIVRPAKHDLMRILEECWEAGTLKAVLDTAQDGKQMLFDILEVLQANRRMKGEG
ncbi:MAG TPA: hypothetical protein VG125_33635 [Pirellulales bacterium]|jgi:hypothetical protein|nr:hypothetical protein [Pirellulales bacterium]